MELINKVFPSLYSRDSKGRIKVWDISTVSLHTEASIGIYHGLLNGKLEEELITVKEGKNLGKTNATTPYTQAISDAESRWNHKKREGYKSLADLEIVFERRFDKVYNKYYDYHRGTYDYDTLETALGDVLPKDNTDKDGNLKPMKAQPYEARKAKFPMIAQPKINGFRCVARMEMRKIGMFEESTVVFRSKNGLEYNLPHIAKDLEKVFAATGQDVVLDGEMYIPGMALQKISSAVRKPNPNTIKLKFYIFDLAMAGMSQEDRLTKIVNITDGSSHFRFEESETRKWRVLNAYGDTLNYKTVPSILIQDDEQLQVYTDMWISAGFEGAILRDVKAEYAFGKRPKTMLKLKRSQDAEFKILDVILPEDENPQYSVLLCKNDINDETFKATPEGDLEWRANLWKNREELRGKDATIKFYERTEDGKPFHATVIDIRDYE